MSNVGDTAAASRDVVLVTGPRLAGTTGVAAALRDRLPGHTVVESAELCPGEAPVAVVFVVSATAPLTPSDCALLDGAAASTDMVVGVVAKTDVHRTWRQVLQADRAVVAAYRPRYAGMRWVGAAATPDIGPPTVDLLIELVRAGLADPTLAERNRLRAKQSELLMLSRRYDGVGRDGGSAALRERRGALLRQCRLDRSRQAIALRGHSQQARLRLSYLVRNRCASVRADLQRDAAATRRRTRDAFIETVRRQVSALVDEVDDALTGHLAALGDDLGLSAVEMPPPPPAAPVRAAEPPLRSRRLESRLMTLLGAGFGLGVALTLSRLLVGVAPGATAAVVCAVVGVALTAWVVGTRGLLLDRAMLDRWVAEVMTALRTALEERVAGRMLTAESVFGRAAAERDVAAGARVDGQVADIDRKIRQHTAARTHELSAISRALAAIDAALAGFARPGGQRSSESFL